MQKKAEFLPDTNVLLRYLLQDEPEQFSQAEIFFEKIRHGRERAFILEGVLVECLYVLTKYYHVSRETAANSLIGILQYKGIITTDKAIFIEGLSRFATGNLDPVDCILLARAQHYGQQIFSFDKDLNKAVARP